MGCGNSILNNYNLQNQKPFFRKNRNKQQEVRNNGQKLENIFQQNVIKSKRKPTAMDLKIAQKTIDNHYLFYRLSQIQKNKFIKKFQIYEAPQNQIIFKKGDIAKLFFIIKSGRVAISLNNKQKEIKQLGKYQFFGQLALIYTSPRSATIKTLQKCEFLCISNHLFKSTMQSLTNSNYQFAKNYIDKITLFKYLTAKQKTLLIHNINSLKFNREDIIFKEGDDANSFFIIVEGKVRLQIPSKPPLFMGQGETFGQNSFKKNQLRHGTSICQTQAHLISISRQSILKCFNGQIRQLIFYNIIKWSLKRLNEFMKFSNIIIQKIIKKCQIKQYKEKKIIANKGDSVISLIICLEDKINGEQTGFIFNSEYLIDKKKQQRKVQSQNIIKQGDGHICFLYLNILNNQFFGALEDIVKQSAAGQDLLELKSLKKFQIAKLQLSELKIIKQIGIGYCGKVFQVEDQCGGNYALKCISKSFIIQKQMEIFVKRQKQISQIIENSFIAGYYRTFKDQNYIYFLMKLVEGKDFYQILKQIGLLNYQQATFYIGCLIQAIEYLHNKDIVYRDLKPQNAILDKNGYLILTDFGTAKILKQQNGYRTFTIIGTPHYLAPEILQGKGYSFPVDIWALGIIFYQMVCGRLPYGQLSTDPIDIYKQIIKYKIKFPEFYKDQKGKKLICNLLIHQPQLRNIEQFAKLKNEPYFQNINWQKLKKKKLPIPYISNSKDLRQNIKINIKVAQYMNDTNIKNQRTKNISKIPSWDQIF